MTTDSWEDTETWAAETPCFQLIERTFVTKRQDDGKNERKEKGYSTVS